MSTRSHLPSSLSSPSNFANQLLLAMPGMLDDNFAGSVVYLLEHTDKGAMGLVVNRPTELVLSTLFETVSYTHLTLPTSDLV